jgi:trk system potassium uptake protein TrkA
VIAVDKHADRIQAIANDVSYAMTADATDMEVIDGLGLENVDGVVITMADNMDASIVTTMACKEHGVETIIARAKNEIHGRILEKLGASRVVYPEREMGERIVHYLTARDFTDWIDLSPEYSLVEMPVPAAWVGKSLHSLELRQKFGLNIVGIRRGEKMEMQFPPKEPLEKDMILYVIGKNTQLEQL